MARNNTACRSERRTGASPFQKVLAMKLSNIRDIIAVAETGSLRAASRKLGITQPTMTRSIRDTEDELGVVMFERNVQGVVPTEMGQIVIRRAIAIQAELRKIHEGLSQARGELSGEVSVAMSGAASIVLIPAVLQKFEEKYPKALLKLTEAFFDGVEADVLSGEVDFYVGPFHSDAAKKPLRVETLFENRRSIVARKGHPLANAASLEELRDARWVRPSLSDHRDETDFEAVFEEANLPPPNVVVHAQSAVMTKLAVANSDLLTILPPQWSDLSLHGQNLFTLASHATFHAAPVCIIRRSDLPLTPLAEAFYDMVQKAGQNYQRQLERRTKQVIAKENTSNTEPTPGNKFSDV
jgi:LysR family transcriptional regulator, regulator of abg operon